MPFPRIEELLNENNIVNTMVKTPARENLEGKATTAITVTLGFENSFEDVSRPA